MIAPDLITASLEVGSAVFQWRNVKAIRRDKKLAGVSWVPSFFFMSWGLYNLWFYDVMALPLSWWGGLAITIVNAIWLAHVFHYAAQARGLSYRAYILEGITTCRASLQQNFLNCLSLAKRLPSMLSSLKLPSRFARSMRSLWSSRSRWSLD